MRARAHNDDAAVRQSVNEKHQRYPDHRYPGVSLVPFVLACGGRPSEEVEALVRYWGSARKMQPRGQ
eukprot:2267453-Karenia_brevis.AAC.1